MKNTILFVFMLISTFTLCQSNKHTLVFLNKKTDKPKLEKVEEDKIMEGHMANINKMATEGKLIVAGPFEGGGGIFIFNSTSVEEVKIWIGDDPGIKANRWNIEVLPFTIRMGSACAVKEPYEMTTYQFIRYTANLAKFTISDAPLTFKKHDEYVKEIARSGNVIAEGIVGNRDGGILILKGDLKRDVIETDYAVQAGLLDPDFKVLWVAKGSFCEK